LLVQGSGIIKNIIVWDALAWAVIASAKTVIIAWAWKAVLLPDLFVLRVETACACAKGCVAVGLACSCNEVGNRV